MVILNGRVIDPETNFDGIRKVGIKDGEAAYSTRIASVNKLNQIFTLLDEGLMEGAIGIGSLVGYASTGITSREMFETQK